MEKETRFTILTFPQYFNGEELEVNIVFMPRNQNPLMPAVDPSIPPGAPAFADAKLAFQAKIIDNLSDLPKPSLAVTLESPLGTTPPTKARDLFLALAKQFTITNLNAVNSDTVIEAQPKRANKPLPLEQSVKKYLPLSYRGSFHFVAPRTKNAVTDDAYLCAVRDAKVNPLFKRSPDEVSWGKVFAYALRQPLLAEALGMIYRTKVTIDASSFPKGGWLYVDLTSDSHYYEQLQNTPNLIKNYAARIPALEPDKRRQVFAAVQFPVATAHVDTYDSILIETADYDDGFAKIIHAFQPVSANLLLEESDGFHPTKEAGIRLGWDDEQILIWYLRLMSEDPSVGSGARLDAPLGVSGYRIDVKGNDPGEDWASLNQVSSKKLLELSGIKIGDFGKRELNYQVYPSQLDGYTSKNYWLPMYFANWNGKSMVLQDQDAARIYQHQEVKQDDGDDSINVTAAPANALNTIYDPVPAYPPLRYGNTYHFRVRLGDISGGGPDVERDPVYETVSQTVTVPFKRYVAPAALRIKDLPVNIDAAFYPHQEVKIKRPLLGYPAVLYTGKYTGPAADPIALLEQASKDMAGVEAFGIPDPDVQSVEIIVEVQSLKMDNLMSLSGKEPYIKLYRTIRDFPAASPTFDDELVVGLTYKKDCKVLNFGDPNNLGDLGQGVTEAKIGAMSDLILPGDRNIRLTMRAVCKAQDAYYGLENQDNPDLDTRYGRITQFVVRHEPVYKDELFLQKSPGKTIQGIYLQPDPPFGLDGSLFTLLLGKEVEKAPDMIQRLAQQLGLESKGLTLTGKKGERVQFGCSQRIRHTLSPENASITFASKADLMNHWLCCLMLDLDRDWTWDALADRSFVIHRQQSFESDGPASLAEPVEVGDIELKRTVPFNALEKPDRRATRLIFIDAVEPKRDPQQPSFPDIIELQYTVTANFIDGSKEKFEVPFLKLPITLPPAQVPKIASAGIALSPYQRNDRYSQTEVRRRFLWLEFEEPVQDPKTTYFARVLAYAPDQLISNNNPELLVAPDEPALPIDPELIRVITPEQPDDEAGLNAMQPLEAETGDPLPRHYLLPLPPALHAESPELFGFFTYEFRVGHYRYFKDTINHSKGDTVWTTAQGRFGRALRTAGVQHPVPTLTCTVNRDEEKVYVTAPYAFAVAGGKNVTADPPRTELWCLLYAQVKQADNQDYRNVLLDDKMLDWRLRVEHHKKVDWQLKYTRKQEAILKQAVLQNWQMAADIGALAQMHQLADDTGVNKDATKYGTVIWTNQEISQILSLYGLPLDSRLSVLCVELLPQITNLFDHVSSLEDKTVQTNLRKILQNGARFSPGMVTEGLKSKAMTATSVNFNREKPLSDKLGHFRILRTSPLSEVPFICCPEC